MGLRIVVLLLLASVTCLLQAQPTVPSPNVFPAEESLTPQLRPPARFLAHIEVHTVTELQSFLQRAEDLFESGSFRVAEHAPVAFVLHGPEAKALLRSNYRENKQLVDMAARLSAFKVIDIKVCQTWLGGQGLDAEELPPFIGTVPFGPKEERRLLEDGAYVYF